MVVVRLPLVECRFAAGSRLSERRRAISRPPRCDDPSAKYQVVQIFEDQKEPSDFTNPCNDIANADASYWEGKQGSTGRVLCLKKL